VLDSAEVKSVRFDSTLDLERSSPEPLRAIPILNVFRLVGRTPARVSLRQDRPGDPWARPQPPILHTRLKPYVIRGSSSCCNNACQLIPSEAGSIRRSNSQSTRRYQAAAIAFYHDSAHERLDRVLGFIVNVGWVRDHYFPN
jgi:hypothetical protein